MATTFGIAIVRPPTVLGRRKNSTSGETKYAKKIERTSNRRITVIFESTQSSAPTASNTMITRSTTRVEGPYDASTAAFAAVAAVSLVVCRSTKFITARAIFRSNHQPLADHDCLAHEIQLRTYQAWNDESLRQPVTMRLHRRAARARDDLQSSRWDTKGDS